MLRPRLMNEEDRDKRERLSELRTDLTEEHLNSLHLHATEVVHEETERLGAPNYADLYREFGLPLDDLAAQCRAFLSDTESLWEEAGDRFFRSRLGLGLGEVERWDVGRAFRGVGWDAAFPADGDDAGARGDARRARRRPPRAAERRDRRRGAPEQGLRAPSARPIEVPGRVVLVIKPQGGPTTGARSSTRPATRSISRTRRASLATEERRLGDNAVTEGWAMLLEHLTFDPVWLVRRLDFAQPHAVRAPRARRSSSGSCAATARSSSTSSSSTQPTT